MKRWEICCNCDGNGSHAKHLGIINTEEWSDEELDAYMDGGYDTACEVCDGTGKVYTENNRVEKYYATDEEYYRNREGGY